MYDASLDQFKPHDWQFSPVSPYYYYSYNRSSADRSFGTDQFIVRNQDLSYYTKPKQYFDQLDWFGFSITNNSRVKQRYLERLYSTGMPLSDPSKVSMGRNKNGRKGFVSGGITSAEDGSPLPGVNVVVKGTRDGTITDEQGATPLKPIRETSWYLALLDLPAPRRKLATRTLLTFRWQWMSRSYPK